MECRSSGYSERIRSNMSQEQEGYGVHQDRRHSSGHPGGNCPRCIQVLRIKGQERVGTVAGTMP
jgi:hypothetical protein